MTSPPAHLHRVHPPSHSAKRGGLSDVIHRKDAVSFTVVLLSDAAKSEQTWVKGMRKIRITASLLYVFENQPRCSYSLRSCLWKHRCFTHILNCAALKIYTISTVLSRAPKIRDTNSVSVSSVPEIQHWIMARELYFQNIMLSQWSWTLTFWIPNVIKSSSYPVRHLWEMLS